jgi:antitoxin CptB
MKELDILLQRYLTQRWPSAAPPERALFERFLKLPDPELAACLLSDAEIAHREFAPIVDFLRRGPE